MNKVKKALLLILILAVLAVFFFGEVLPYVGGGENSPLEQAAAALEQEEKTLTGEESALPVYVVRYMLDGREYYSEKVKEGSCPKEELIPADCNFLGWQDESGCYADAAAVPVLSDRTYTAVVGPELKVQPAAFFPAAENGLFFPNRALTRSELAQLVYTLLENAPESSLTVPDAPEDEVSARAIAAAAELGYVPLKDGNFRPEDGVTAEEFCDTLSFLFNGDRVSEQLSAVSGSVTRGDAVLAVCSLLGMDGLPEGETGAYYPDVPESLPCYRAAALAGVPSEQWAPAGEKHAAGFVHLNGYLYCFGENGFFVSNALVGSLSFNPDGRFTSGDAELDSFVAERIARLQQENPGADRDALLAKAYAFVRDSGEYLAEEHYEVGETGWETAEALKLFKDKSGSSYSYAAQFWALARGLGFDARCISGLISQNRQNHGWVEIEFDGAPCVFDPEYEGIVYRRGRGDVNTSLYKLSYDTASQWNYIRTPEEIPEETKQTEG